MTQTANLTSRDAVADKRLSRDEKLQERICKQLRNSPYYELRRVTCDVVDGVPFLCGCVSSHYLKQLAQTVALKSAGPVRIRNRIQVQRNDSRSTAADSRGVDKSGVDESVVPIAQRHANCFDLPRVCNHRKPVAGMGLEPTRP